MPPGEGRKKDGETVAIEIQSSSGPHNMKLKVVNRDAQRVR